MGRNERPRGGVVTAIPFDESSGDASLRKRGVRIPQGFTWSLPVWILTSRSEDSLEVSKFPTHLPFLNSNRVTVSAVSVGSKKGPIIESKPSQESILNAILPPREWVENGKQYVQYVSHQQASRVDVARLREQLDQKLMERQARESGICPVREELFSQCFDEIIR